MSFKLNTKQQQAIDEVLKLVQTPVVGRPNTYGIFGPPGSGKSTVIAHLPPSLNITLCATTGKAAALIGGKTIHSLFKIRPEQNHAAKSEDEALNWKIDSEHDLGGDILVVDEASMIDSVMSKAVIMARSYFKLVLYVGDVYQLPPVKGKTPALLSVPHIMLEAQERFKSCPNIQRLVGEVRELIDDDISYIDINQEMFGGNDIEFIQEIPNSMEPHHTALFRQNQTCEELLERLPDVNPAIYNLGAKVSHGIMVPGQGWVTLELFPNGADVTLTIIPKKQWGMYGVKQTKGGTKYRYFDTNLKPVEGMQDIRLLSYPTIKGELLDSIYLAQENTTNQMFFVFIGDYKLYKNECIRTFDIAKSSTDKLLQYYQTDITAIIKDKGYKDTRKTRTFILKRNYQEDYAPVSLAWQDYFNFKDLPFVRDGRARTVHKSQGSTFDEVYVDLTNMRYQNGNVNLNQLYVALSRASTKLYIRGEHRVWAKE